MTTVIFSILLPTLAVAALLPQLIKAHKTKSTKDVSLATFLIMVTSAILWIVYGLLRADIVIIINNTLIVLIAGLIVSMKLRYG